MATLRVNMDGLTAPQARFLSELVKARSVLDAAKASHTSETTARSWLRLPHFQAAYRALRLELVESAIIGLQQASRMAVAERVDGQFDGATVFQRA
jgi:hypothetical protein